MREASSPAPSAYVSFRKEPSPEGRGGEMGKATPLFYRTRAILCVRYRTYEQSAFTPRTGLYGILRIEEAS
jgi:hypothetical protein